MAKRPQPKTINEALRQGLDLRTRAVNVRIAKMASALAVSRHIAALAIAQDERVPYSKFASAEELKELREARSHLQGASSASAAAVNRGGVVKARRKAAPPAKNVFVVHGRNNAARVAVFDFLRAIGLSPIEWSVAMKATRNAAPYIGDVLERAFQKARAVVVIFTPDDMAYLKKTFRGKSEERHEKQPTGQARPNVLFEAGMAFGSHPRATVLVEIGRCRPFSDIYGRHVVRLTNAESKRQELADKLETAGCEVVIEGRQWLEVGDFDVDLGEDGDRAGR